LFIKGIPSSWNPVLPGLEVKYALEEAEKQGSQVVLLGHELDQLTWDRLYHETRNTVFRWLRGLWRMNRPYYGELVEHNAKLRNYGPTKFVESTCDQYHINW
jgi:hypothetical protein